MSEGAGEDGGAGQSVGAAVHGGRGGPLSLTGFLPVWDVERRRADLGEIAGWALERAREMGYPAESLDTLHWHLDARQAMALTHALTRGSVEERFQRILHRAVREAVPELPQDRVWIQTIGHFRILVPGDTVAPVPPHTDVGFGHSPAERNVWLSLTDAVGDAALHVLPLGASLSWMGRTGMLYGVIEEGPEIPAVPTRAGEVLLFTPLHIHRARPPSGDRCRVSVDVRLVPEPVGAYDLTFSPLRGTP
ncbi:MAG: phytanoyl-CoA dioxygenase family protein [Polyangiaceae bacterium]